MNTNFYFLIFFFAILEFDGIFALECYFKSGDGPQSVINCPPSSFVTRYKCFTELCPDSFGNYKVFKGCWTWSLESCSPESKCSGENKCMSCESDLCNNENIKMTKCYQKLYVDDENAPIKKEINCPIGNGFSCFTQTCGTRDEIGEVKGCTKDCYGVCVSNSPQSKCYQCTTELCNYSASPSANIFLLTFFAIFLALEIFAY